MSSGPGVDVDGSVNPVESDFYKNLPAGMEIAHGISEGKRFEMNPGNVAKLFERTVRSAAEFIEKQEEGVTLVIPMMGGVPLADELLRELASRGYDLDKLDIRLAKKLKEGNTAQADETYIFDDETTPPKAVRVMIDDIVDKAGAYKQFSKKLSKESPGKLVCFTATVKGPKDDGSEGTFAYTDIARISTAETVDGQKEYADINYTAILDNKWIHSGFGMNSGISDDLLKIAESEKAEDVQMRLDIVKGYTGTEDKSNARFKQVLTEIQIDERLSNICLYGKPENIAEYGLYLRELHNRYPNNYPQVAAIMYQVEAFHFMRKHSGSKEEAQEKMKMIRDYFVDLLRTLQHLQMLEAQSEYRMDLL